jgi:hypothetical protein
MSSNISEIFENSSTLQMSSNISEIFENSSTLQMSSPISRVLCQDPSLLFFRHLVVCQDNLSDCSLKPAFRRAPIITASSRAQIKSKNIIIKKNPQRSRTCSFKIKRHPQSTSLFCIEPRDLQVLIIVSKVDGLTSAIQSLAPCTDLHCSFFRYLTCLSRSTLQPDALHRLLKYPMDTDLQPNAPQSTRSYRLAARCITSAFLTDTLIVLVHSLMHYIGFITRLPTCSGNIS